MRVYLTSFSKIRNFIFCICSFAVISSCDDSVTDEIAPSGEGRLKRVLLYGNIDDSNPINIVEEYEYDDDGRISRVSSPMYEDGEIVGEISYDLYEYDADNQLVKKSNYNANSNAPTGFINLKNYVYTYGSNGKIKRETIEYPQIGSSEYSLHMYDSDRLVRIEEYDRNSELERYVINEYDKGSKLVKETSFDKDNQSYGYTEHFYTNGLNTESKIHVGVNLELLREIHRTFDKNNNLIILESKEMSMLSSRISHVLKYEYY